MTRSQSRVQKFFAGHPFLVFLVLVVALLLVTAGVATLVKGVFGVQGPPVSSTKTGAARPEPTPSMSSSFTPDPSVGVETGDAVTDNRCEATLTPKQFQSLTNRILDYEEARLQPSFDTDEKTMRTFASDAYVAAHKGSAPPTAGTDIVVKLDRSKTIIGCYTLSSSRIIVQTMDVIATYRLDSSGNRTLINQFANPLPAHNTGWVLQKGLWYVDSEQK